MKKILFLLLFIIFTQDVFAEAFQAGWNLGDFGLSYNSKNRLDLQVRIAGFNLFWSPFAFHEGYYTINVMNYFFLDASLYKLIYTRTSYTSFLPVEIAYSPVNIDDKFFLLLYGRSEWQFLKGENDPYFYSGGNRFLFTSGIRISRMWLSLPLHYASSMSLFLEYNIANELRIGATVDIGAFILMSIGNLSKSYNENKEGHHDQK
ncbi:MAG: hypothetical protein LBK08_01535 [Treponema sp.]|nr:hypothetical protein [Treponema sp.]